MRIVSSGAILALSLAVAGCRVLDTEDSARAMADQWLFVGKPLAFVSQRNCTVGVFDIVSDSLRATGGPAPVNSVRAAVPFLEQGRAVAFVVPGKSPNTLSEELMSINLFEGLGLLGSYVGAAKACMNDEWAEAAHIALTSPDSVLIFDPERYAIVLFYRPGALAYYLRIPS